MHAHGAANHDHNHLGGGGGGDDDDGGVGMAVATSSAEALKTMVVVAFFMFAGALVAGLTWMPLTRASLDLVNVFGVGLLLGTGLGVIVPEGVRELATAEYGEQVMGVALVAGFVTLLLVDHLACCGNGSGSHGHSHDVVEAMTPVKQQSSAPLQRSESSKRDEDAEQPEDVHAHEDHVAASKRRRATVTLGLLIHNMADGLAMGASKASRREWTSAQMLVFSAIMLHHIPAAFGFAAFLRSSGLDEALVRQRVVVFASAGPVAALCAFVVLEFGVNGKLPKEAVGACLLFSGGSFIYVAAVHALDEARKGGLLSAKQLGVLCAGAVLPLIMSAGHEH